MAESLINERVDDITVLLHVLEGMGLPRIINEVCPPHGNWGCLSIGEICSVWIAHILSTADRRPNFDAINTTILSHNWGIS